MPGTSRLAKMARITAKIASGLAAIVFLTLLALFIVNSFDVPLTAQAKALLTPPPNPYPSDQNIYLAMGGMEGRADRPITEMGRERIDVYNQALDSVLQNPDSAFNLSSDWDATKIQLSGKLELGSPRSTSIWESTRSNRQEIAAMLAANQQLYQRYLSLHRLRGYYDTARPSYVAPLVLFPPQLRTLFLADVANRIQTGAHREQRDALDDIRQDLQIWRTVLKGHGTLISKLLAVAYLHADLILVADLIADPNVNLEPLEDMLEPALLPFDPKDYKIGNAFAAEFRASAAVYKTITAPNELTGSTASSSWRQRVSNAFQAHFFKLNATENMGAALAAQWVELGDSAASKFDINRERYHQWLEKNEPHLSAKSLYNPIGNILIRIAIPNIDTYPLRAYDVAAFQRLVYLAYQLKRQHVATPDVAAFLEAHPDWSTHPVDGKPFRWNVQTGELAVNTLGDNSKGRRFSVMSLPISRDQKH